MNNWLESGCHKCYQNNEQNFNVPPESQSPIIVINQNLNRESPANISQESKQELQSLHLRKFHTYLDLRPMFKNTKSCPYPIPTMIDGIIQPFLQEYWSPIVKIKKLHVDYLLE